MMLHCLSKSSRHWYYTRMPGNRKVNPYRFLFKKRRKKGRRRKKAHIDEQSHPAETSLDWMNPTDVWETSTVVKGFMVICYLTKANRYSIWFTIWRNHNGQGKTPPKNRMGQLKCNSSKSGIYRIIAINLYIKVIRIIFLFFYRNSSKSK